MNPPLATADGYIQSLIGSPVVVSATEAARVHPERPNAPAHDAFTRRLHRLDPTRPPSGRRCGRSSTRPTASW